MINIMLSRDVILVGFFVLFTSVNVDGFTFLGKNNTYIQYYPEWSEYEVQVIYFRFRTWKANVVLVHHSLRNTLNKPVSDYFMHVSLRGGELQILHTFQAYEDALRVGKGLNINIWHDVFILKDPQTGNLSVQLDGVRVSKSLSAYVTGNALQILTEQPVISQILIGGFDDLKPNVVYRVKDRPRPLITTKTLTGCIDNIKFGTNIDNVQVIPFRRKSGVHSGCVNQCRHNPCLKGGQCINEYTSYYCDCLGTGREGSRCQLQALTTVTLQGFDWISYNIYASHEQAHSLQTRITLEFRTRHENGVLFYAGDSYPVHNHVAVSIGSGVVHVSVAFADKEISTNLGLHVNDNEWHNLTIAQYDKNVKVTLDGVTNSLVSNGQFRHLYLNPVVYIGGGDRMRKPHPEPAGLKTRLNFVGCLRSIYFNHHSILEEMVHQNAAAEYHGSSIKKYCATPEAISASFTKQGALITIPTPNTHGLRIEFKFRTIRTDGLLLLSKITGNRRHKGTVTVYLSASRIKVLVIPSLEDEFISQSLVSSKNVSDNRWHRFRLDFSSMHIEVEVDYSPERRSLNDYLLLETEGKFYLGSDPEQDETVSFVGCIKGIKVEGKLVEMREIVHNSVKEVVLDNCNLRDYCKYSSQCQHGSTCLSDWYQVQCDCSRTGYEGKSCHFAKYRKSCDEYYLAGVKHSSIRRIDIDGNGPMPPSYVNCEMGSKKDESGELTGVTIVDNNLYKRTTIHHAELDNLKKIISYRDMNKEMLNKLTNASFGCEQDIAYKCWNSPIRLGLSSWMISASGHKYSALGAESNGVCGCHANFSCVTGYSCNCDASYRRWMTDFGTYTDKLQVPVTEMIFLQDTGGVADVTLGPLKCYGTASQFEYDVTFGPDAGDLQLPGWQDGDLSLWFRTTGSGFPLVRQKEDVNDLVIRVVNVTAVVFNFTTSNRRHVFYLKSVLPIDNEGWHYVAVEVDDLQIRLVFDLTTQLIDLVNNDKVIYYSSSLILGGTVGSGRPSFRGCFRKLFYNNSTTLLSSYIMNNITGIKKGCYPWCKPNPCKYGGVCVEFWTSYKCNCAKPASHFGDKCEINIDKDVVTFLSKRSYLEYFLEKDYDRLIQKNITISFRTNNRYGFLFYAHDEFNNFIQLEVVQGNLLRYTYNVGIRIHIKNIPVIGLSDGSWKQLVIIQHWDWLDIQVNGGNQIEMGIRRLRLISYTTKPFIHPETVTPERPIKPVKAGLRVFVGGLPSTYKTEIPQYIGCIRGFKLGENIFNLSSNANPENGTHPTCVSGCDLKPCRHAAYCEERWLGRYKCNCSGTSYSGKRCDSETGALFDGRSIVAMNLPRSGANDLTETMSFAFSTDVSRHGEPILVFVESSDYGEKTYLAVFLDGYANIMLKLYFGTGNFFKYQLKGNFNDGKRHFVTYNRQKNWITLRVDDKEEKYQMLSGPFILAARKLTLGGYMHKGKIYGLMETFQTNYTGCISNFQYWEGERKSTSLKPLNLAFAKNPPSSIQTRGNVHKGQCAKFAILIPFLVTTPAPIPGLESHTFPPWPLRPADTVEYIVDNTIFPVGESVENSPSTTMIIAAALIVMMILIAAIIALVLRAVYRNRKKKKDEMKKKEYEKVELFERPDFTKPPRDACPSNYSEKYEPDIERDYGLQNGDVFEKLGNVTLRPSMLRLPSHTPAGSSILSHSSASHIASTEDLTDMELESPSKPNNSQRIVVPVDYHNDPLDLRLPLVSQSPEMRPTLRRKKRSPSSISEVLAEMEKLNRDIPNVEDDDELWLTPGLHRNSDRNKSADLEWDNTPLLPMSDQERGRNTGTEYGSMDLSNGDDDENDDDVHVPEVPDAFRDCPEESGADGKRPGSASTSSSSGIYGSNKGSDYEMLDRDTYPDQNPHNHHHHPHRHHHHHHRHPPNNQHPTNPIDEQNNATESIESPESPPENQPTRRHRDPRIYDILNNPHVYETML